jgi:hypothetical protein
MNCDDLAESSSSRECDDLAESLLRVPVPVNVNSFVINFVHQLVYTNFIVLGSIKQFLCWVERIWIHLC